MKHIKGILAALTILSSQVGFSQAADVRPKITIVNMGGNDCPPCLAWRRFDLPKLQAEPEFQGVQFIHVEKSIMSAVPPRFFLPEEAKPYKPVLDAASGGMRGSPQVAVVVNDQIYDYFYGARAAEDYVRMIQSIRTGSTYPFPRCLKRRDAQHCTVPADPPR